jgi:acylphosphatase
LNIKVSGRVQGVWFRASTKKEADRLGISGFVRNEADGDVYLEAEGEEAVLENLVDWLWQGPPNARVENVHFEEGEKKDFSGFDITR